MRTIERPERPHCLALQVREAERKASEKMELELQFS